MVRIPRAVIIFALSKIPLRHCLITSRIPTVLAASRPLRGRQSTNRFSTTIDATTMSTSTAGSSYFHPKLRGVFVGSGSEGMADPRVADAILDLWKQDHKETSTSPTVLYLGTATYDLSLFRTKQTKCLEDLGCAVTSLNVAFENDTIDLAKEAAEKLEQADIIVVGGGNTLYAMDRWTKLGLIPMMRQAMERGAILCGGSAGAIVWFDGGHSDSMDPDTYANPMLEKFGGTGDQAKNVADESSALGETIKDWKYIRVNGLGFLPGLLCPHHDRVQSNGILRANDFDEMLLRHSRETGIGIDHWAALIVSGDNYRILSLEGKPGSVVYKGGDNQEAMFGVENDGTATGAPGVWIKRVDETSRSVVAQVCPAQGNIHDLRPPSEIVEDSEAINQCRAGNPS